MFSEIQGCWFLLIFPSIYTMALHIAYPLTPFIPYGVQYFHYVYWISCMAKSLEGILRWLSISSVWSRVKCAWRLGVRGEEPIGTENGKYRIFQRISTWFCYTVQCHYNTVNFLQYPHNRHPITCPLGQGMGCLLCFSSLIHVLLLSLQCHV